MKSAAQRRPRRVMVATALGAVLLLSACSGQQAGSAAVLGDSRITEQQLTAAVQAVLTAQGQAVDTADASVTQQTLTRLIIIDLVDTLAERAGIVVTQGALDETTAQYVAQSGGDEAAMESTFVQQGVAPSMIPAIIRLNLQAQDLGQKLKPNGTAEEQGQAVFDAVVALSDALDVTSSPRFGTWDAKALQVGPITDDLSTLPTLDK